MGVPHFYKWLSERYPLINQLFTESSVNIDIENLYLDLNGLIHTATHNNDQILSYAQDELDVVVSMFAYIDHLISTIRPSQLLYLAVDGVPPRAKINQQRKRRFKAAMDLEKQLVKTDSEELSEKKAFDSNCITPGTEFMRKVDEGIRSMLLYKIETDTKWQQFQVIYSGYNVPGEGEHKIIEYMRNLKREHQFKSNNRHCIYGLDADLILLSLSLHEPNIIILREILDCTKFNNNGHNENHLIEIENPKLQLIHINILREYLHLDFYNEKYLAFYNLERIIDDFIFLVTLCGNDFLPSCPSIDIKSGSLTKLMDFYKTNLETNHNYLLERGKINLSLFEKLCKCLSESEEENIKNIYTKSISKRSYRRGRKGKVDNYKEEEYIEQLGEEELSVKNIYYLSKFNIKPEEKERKDEIVQYYIQGLMWVLDYYYRGCPSWSWFYPFHYSPLFSDFIDLMKYNKLIFEIDSSPVDPLIQLLCCLPPYSCSILPESYRGFMVNPDSPIIDYYPKEFEIDMDGKVKDYEGEIIIPFIDVNKIISLVKDNNLNDSLTSEEIVRNTLCYKDLCYKYNPTLTPRPGVTIFSNQFFPLDCTHISITEIPVKLPNPCAKSVNKLNPTYNKEISRIPSLHSYPFFMKKARIGIEIFGNVAKAETIVLAINKPEEDNKDPEMGKYCYFGYPSQLSGIITSIKYGSHKLYYEESIFTDQQTLKTNYQSIKVIDKEYDNEEIASFETETQMLHNKWLKGICNQFGTGGIELNGVVCVVEIHPLVNMIPIDNYLLRKFSKESFILPFNVVRYSIPNSDSKFEESNLIVLPPHIELGDTMIITDKTLKYKDINLYGNSGIVTNIIDNEVATIELSLNNQFDNNFGFTFLSNHKLQMYSLEELNVLFNMDKISLFRLLDSVIINKQVDIGLNFFDFHDVWYYNPDYVYINSNKEIEWIDNDEATLYIAGNVKTVLNRTRDTEKEELMKIVEINEDGVKLLKDFIENFPKVCELVKTKDSINYKSQSLGTNKEYHNMINRIKEWRKKNININASLIQCKSERFTKSQLQCLNKILNDTKIDNEIVKIDVPFNSLSSIQQIDRHYDIIKKPILGSRVISIGLSNIPPGLKGTVVSIYRNLGLIDVVFDKPFISGTRLKFMCEIGHGQTVKYSDVIVIDN